MSKSNNRTCRKLPPSSPSKKPNSGGVSQLARVADLNREALSRALSGKRTPQVDTLRKLSNACGGKLQFSA